jgi:nucleotide-binding universal stress UspA family protein
MTRGAHHLRWTVVAGYEGSASSEDALALARSFLGAAGGRLVVGCVYQYQPLRGRFASGELAAAVARRGCRAARSGKAEPMAVPGVSPAEGLCSLAAAAHADLVVVGSARRALRGRLLRGSTADGVLSRGVCSVAIAPSGYRSHQRRFRTIGVIFDATLSSRAAVRAAAAIALADNGVLRVYAPAGALPGDDIQGVLAPLLGGAPLQAAASVRAVTADSAKILDLVIASSQERFRLPGFGRRQGGRWIRACRCPVLVLPESQTAAGDSAPVADREEATW